MSDDVVSGATNINVALLRGINAGGKNTLPMKQLAAMFQAAGCGDVQTYIQSGNVLFRAAPSLAERIPSLISDKILSTFGFTIPIVTRTARELQEIVQANPFTAVEENKLLVFFLTDLPDPERIAELDPNRSPGDEFAVLGREIFAHYPNGVARSKLTHSYFESRLSTTSTNRNLRTVKKLLELAAATG